MVGRGHPAIEERLQGKRHQMGDPAPGLFMQNVLGQAASIKTDSKMVLPFAKDLPVALIDVRDTGAVGARILVDPAPHVGKTYEFTGKLTTYGAFAEVFSQVLGRPITYVGITPEQAEQGMKSRGMPDWLVAHLVTIAKRRRGRRSFDREHQADRGPRRARADHDQTVRRGFQGAVRWPTRWRNCTGTSATPRCGCGNVQVRRIVMGANRALVIANKSFAEHASFCRASRSRQA